MKRNTQQVGFFSALLVMVFTVWFMIAFALYSPALFNWHGVEPFARSFNPGSYIAWVVPCLLLALAFPILGVSIFMLTDESKRIWGIIGLVFAAMYGAILTTDYWLLATVVRQSITDGNFSGLEWLIVGSPHSITNAIEGIGYAFMGLSVLFQSGCFDSGRLGRWISALLLINGVSTVLSVVAAAFGITIVTWIVLGIWGISFPVVMLLIALYFHRQPLNA